MEKKTFEQVYEDNFSYVYNYVYMQLLHKENTEDIVSEAFMKAYSVFDKYDASLASEKTWLCRIAKNLLIDNYRKNASNKVDAVESEVLEAVPCDGEYEAVEDETNAIVFKLLSELKEDEREILTMKYTLEMSNPDIAEILGINAKAVCERVRRALKKCEKIGNEKYFDIIVDYIK